jgi:hypothetical protein
MRSDLFAEKYLIMKKCFFFSLFTLAFLTQSFGVEAKSRFVHPGISHTQADLDRMKAMVDAKVEPFYTNYQTFANSSLSKSTYTPQNIGITYIRENGMDLNDFRAAYNNALMWHLTGLSAHAELAIKIINGFSGLTNVSSRGTGPLNSSKIHLLIEAAELMRHYSGWTEADQQAFRDMLVYPGYNTKVNRWDTDHSYTETSNNITWYWNCFNFDSGRVGNQELMPERMIMALGIFLDNDTIYDRGLRYYCGLPHRSDDLPYALGPRVHSTFVQDTSKTVAGNATMIGYGYSDQTIGTTADYGYNGQLQHYIWPNGQTQEMARDQGHGVLGIGVCASIAEMAWNQGDDIYSYLNDRLLLGSEFVARYNVSYQYYSDYGMTAPWEPTALQINTTDTYDTHVATSVSGTYGRTVTSTEPTFENGIFISQRDRTNRWLSLWINDQSRGSFLATQRPFYEMLVAHYGVRLGMDGAKYLWTQRARDKSISVSGYEQSGQTTDHLGYGALTMRRTALMAGDPVTYIDGERVFGIHQVPGTIKAVDYDYFTTSGNGHTYFDTTPDSAKVYRTDEQVDIEAGDHDFVVSKVADTEWMLYTVAIPVTGTYTISVRYCAENGCMLHYSFDGGAESTAYLSGTNGAYADFTLTGIPADRGARVLKVSVEGEDATLKLSTFVLTPEATTYAVSYTSGISGVSQACEGVTVTVAADETYVDGTIMAYDATAKAFVTVTKKEAGVFTFTMPAHAVQLSCLAHPANGMTIPGTITNMVYWSGNNLSYASTGHHAEMSFVVPAGNYGTATFCCAYRSNSQCKGTMTVLCPDGTSKPINNVITDTEAMDVTGTIVSGATNVFQITNSSSSGVDYYTNTTATSALQLPYLILYNQADGLESVQKKHTTVKKAYDLMGRLVRGNSLKTSAMVIEDGVKVLYK